MNFSLISHGCKVACSVSPCSFRPGQPLQIGLSIDAGAVNAATEFIVDSTSFPSALSAHDLSVRAEKFAEGWLAVNGPQILMDRKTAWAGKATQFAIESAKYHNPAESLK